ncbi:PAS domain-containing protein [Rhodovibrionaceae bacterium A322]
MALYGNPQTTGVERKLDPNDIIVSKTDLTGKITYGNRAFYKFADLTEKKCVGVQHNIIRHPDMPRSVFDLLWTTLKNGQEIFAYVVNRSANGDHYWVLAHVTPSRDQNGKITSYHSNRRAPNRQVLTQHITPLYDQLLRIEKAAGSPKEGLAAANKAISDRLADAKMGFNEYMFSLGV